MEVVHLERYCKKDNEKNVRTFERKMGKHAERLC